MISGILELKEKPPNKEFHALVSLTAHELKLNTPATIEKDYYVTQAIHALVQVSNEYFQLVFQGGTCLAKAYRLIQRMSEDCDFRMAAKPAALTLAKAAHRNELRNFRRLLVDSLRKNGFVFEDDVVRARNGGEFMSMRIHYHSLYDKTNSLRPYIALDFFLNSVKTPTESLPVTTLIRNTLGDDVDHPVILVNCLSVTETAAEKWVALTRRVATVDYRQNYRDATLIRHLYDLHQIKSEYFSYQFVALATQITMGDMQQFKNHNPAYYEDPAKEAARALEVLQKDITWKEYWNDFMEDMVFQQNKPRYETALKELIKRSQPVLQSIKNHLLHTTKTQQS